MHSVRHLALWLAAAITMVAVCILPSAASAHAGHEHGATTAYHGSIGGTAADVANTGIDSRSTQVAEPGLRCSGPCCVPSGHVCSSCCATGRTPAAQLSWDGPIAGEAQLARDVPRPPGIAPEALPEPPRPFA